jgi:hypothetical protein
MQFNPVDFKRTQWIPRTRRAYHMAGLRLLVFQQTREQTKHVQFWEEINKSYCLSFRFFRCLHCIYPLLIWDLK